MQKSTYQKFGNKSQMGKSVYKSDKIKMSMMRKNTSKFYA